MTTSYIRSFEFQWEGENIRFTVQTDIDDLTDFRRSQLSEKFHKLSYESFKHFGGTWHHTMKNRMFLSVDRTSNNEIIQYIFELGGDVIITRNTNSNIFDYFLNVMFK